MRYLLFAILVTFVAACSTTGSGAAKSASGQPTDCLRKGLAAEKKGDYHGAYKWYSRGGTVGDVGVYKQAPKLVGAEEAAQFMCQLGFIRTCANLGQKGIFSSPGGQLLGTQVVMDADAKIIDIIDSKPGKKYLGYTSAQIESISEHVGNVLRDGDIAASNAKSARYAQLSASLEAFSAGAQAVFNQVNAGPQPGGITGTPIMRGTYVDAAQAYRQRAAQLPSDDPRIREWLAEAERLERQAKELETKDLPTFDFSGRNSNRVQQTQVLRSNSYRQDPPCKPGVCCTMCIRKPGARAGSAHICHESSPDSKCACGS